jgi:ABC-type Na+ efflux pump permease subunit
MRLIMNKIAVVASTEFGSAVRTKSFIVSILMLPVIWGGAIAVQIFASKADTKPRPFAVIDRTGTLFPVIEKAAEARNASLVTKDGKLSASKFEPSLEKETSKSIDETRLALSDRVRKGEVFAFVEIPSDVFEVNDKTPPKILYHSDNPNYFELREWVNAIVNTEVRSHRYRAAGLDPAVTQRLEQHVPVENLGLLSRLAPSDSSSPGQASGIKAAEKVDPVRTFAVPGVLMFIVFMIVMTSTPQLLNSVIEEKMSRISEVLLGSATPFEIMMGKLLGNVGLALILAFLYVSAGYGVAAYYGYADAVPPHLLALLAFFLLLAIFFYGSLYMAVGSGCSELKDAQSLMMPVMLLSVLPAFVWTAVITNPSSPISVGMSLFPPSTPFLMLLRMALHPAPPLWQVVLSVVLTTLTAIGTVWAAGKIFRTGILMQGKAATFAEMARWVMAK